MLVELRNKQQHDCAKGASFGTGCVQKVTTKYCLSLNCLGLITASNETKQTNKTLWVILSHPLTQDGAVDPWHLKIGSTGPLFVRVIKIAPKKKIHPDLLSAQQCDTIMIFLPEYTFLLAFAPTCEISGS